jgi:PAS domain S-box-containing protein
MTVGWLVIAGWLLDIMILKHVLPGLVSMKFNTALAFVLLGIGLLALVNESDRKNQRVRQVCAAAILILGSLTLSEYLFNWNLGIDEWIVRDMDSVSYPGRMSHITASNFVLLGIALLPSKRPRVTQGITLWVMGVSSIALIGYIYGVESLYKINFYSSVAIHTTTNFFVLCVSILFAQSGKGFMEFVTDNSASGFLLRHLLPLAILIPILIGAIEMVGLHTGLYDLSFQTSLYALSSGIISVIITLWIARSLRQIDNARKQAVDALRVANEQLEHRVHERTAELEAANQFLRAESNRRDQAESSFRALLESAPDAMVIVDADGHIVLVNHQTEALFGYPRTELLGEMVEILMPESYRIKHFDHRTGYTNSPKVRSMGVGVELHSQRKDGSSFPIEVSLSPIHTPQGLLVASAIRDVSKRKEAEEKLRESEERLQTIFDLLPVGASLMNDDKQIIRMNLALEKILDMKIDDLLMGKYRSRQYIHSDGTLMLPTEFPSERTIVEQQPIVDVEIGIIKENGSTIWTNVSAASLPGNQGVVTVTVDMTERKQAEATLQRSEELYRTFARNFPNGAVVLFDHDLRYLAVDGQGLADVGLSKETMEGKTVWEIFPPETTTAIEPFLREALAGNASQHEVPFADRIYAVSYVPVKDESGTIQLGMLMTQDVTAMKHQQVILEEERNRAEQANRLKSQFLATMSHELRTPLNAIIGFSDVLLKGILGETTSIQREHIQDILSNGEHLLALINDILDLSKIEAGQFDLYVTNIDLRRLLEQMRQQLEPLADKKGLDLRTHFDARIPSTVQGDALRIKQILINLVGNAIKFTEQGFVDIRMDKSGDEDWTITISDSGIGIAEESLAHLFQEFRQIDSSAKRRYEGSGLGLAIVQKLVTLMGGTVSVQSELGKGSVFSVHLPLVSKMDI